MTSTSPCLAVPAKFRLTSDTATTWKTFKQKFELYILAGGYNQRPENEKVALLLTIGGDEMIDIFNSFEWAIIGNKEKYDPVIAKFDDYFTPKQHFSELTARYKFNGTVQGTSESLDSFITKLRNIAKDCDFGDQKDQLIRDRIVFGVKEDGLREKLFRKEKLDLESAVKICQAHEATQKGMQALREENIHVVRQAQKYRSDRSKQKVRSDIKNEAQVSKKKECRYCGERHPWSKSKCPAYGKKCTGCGKLNHFQKVCQSSKNKSVNALDEDDDCFSEGTESEREKMNSAVASIAPVEKES